MLMERMIKKYRMSERLYQRAPKLKNYATLLTQKSSSTFGINDHSSFLLSVRIVFHLS